MSNVNNAPGSVNSYPLASEPYEKTFPVVELFGPTIQGEGLLCGQRSHFIRFGGCSHRCSWCDSLHAVIPDKIKANSLRMSRIAIMSAIKDLPPSSWVTLSGGDPCMHDLKYLVNDLRSQTYKVAVETQGAIWQDWLSDVDLVTISPKGPSAEQDHKLDYKVLQKYYDMLRHPFNSTYRRAIWKIVIFDWRDFAFAREIHSQFPSISMYLSIGTQLDNIDDESLHNQILNDMKDVFQETLKCDDMQDVTVLPQLHTLAWGHKKGV